MRLLVLSGTTEAADLIARLAGDARFAVTASLAGRTRAPAALPVPTRIGGFGGVDGLCNWLTGNATDVLVDATHPYAVQMSAHASAAARRTGVPLLSLTRAPWRALPGDDWTEVQSAEAAAALLTQRFPAPATVFLTVGRLDLAPFLALRQYRLVLRTIDPLPELPPGAVQINARGPFSLADETALLADLRPDVLVSKNSGGAATAPKLAAARVRQVPVILLARPPKPAGIAFTDVPALHADLVRRASGFQAPG